MPSSSQRQHNLMELVAHDPAAAHRLGIAQSVGRDFVNADRGRHFANGGGVAGFAHVMPPHLMGGPQAMHAPRLGVPHGHQRSGFAMGGMGVSPSQAEPWWTRSAARAEDAPVHPGGLVASPTGGRADHVPTNVPSDSYILPADVVAGAGQHNTLAGAAVFDQMMKSLPYGVSAPPHGHAMSIPHPEAHPPSPAHFAAGGLPGFAEGRVPHGEGEGPIPVRLSGGEFVVLPKYVLAIGGGDMERGHKILDSMVLKLRDKYKREIARLPGPKKD